MKCVRCPRIGTVLVYQVDTGNMQGLDSGPRTGDIYACDEHAVEIGREPGAWPWLAALTEGAR